MKCFGCVFVEPTSTTRNTQLALWKWQERKIKSHCWLSKGSKNNSKKTNLSVNEFQQMSLTGARRIEELGRSPTQRTNPKIPEHATSCIFCCSPRTLSQHFSRTLQHSSALRGTFPWFSLAHSAGLNIMAGGLRLKFEICCLLRFVVDVCGLTS